MKKFLYIGIVLSFLLITVLSDCGGSNSSGTPIPSLNPTPTTYTPGQSVAYSVGGVTFYMNYAPSGSFTSDDNTVCRTTIFPATVTVSNAYWIAQTVVTYQLWSKVYTWATTTATNKYTFANAGVKGNNGSGSDLQPVTRISWRDAMIWCNALTEYYNSQNSTTYACVYCTDSTYKTPIRSVDNSYLTTGIEDNPCVNATAKGFRLPTSSEWELAARYQNGTNWTPGDHVSGDTSGYCYLNNPPISTTASSVFGNYARWGINYGGDCSSTQPVAQKLPNALGLYDMNGNVWQLCFDWYPGQSGSLRVGRGGGWDSPASDLQVGYVSGGSPYFVVDVAGFRPVRTQ